MNAALTKTQARRIKAAVETQLRDGLPPPEHARKGEWTAVGAAARALGVDRCTLKNRVRKGGLCEQAGFPIDWSLYKPKFDDPVLARAHADESAEQRRRLADLERETHAAREYRATILGLAAEPLRPSILAPGKPQKGARAIVAHLSDVHRGERVSLEEMDGVNVYDSAISRRRLGRFFHAIASLSTEHWRGEPPERVALCLGGDLLSGNIHLELIETNDSGAPKAVREIAQDIAGGIAELIKTIQRPVDVYSVPGNHSRLTIKPQAKRRAVHNLDMLVADFAEAACRGAGIGPDRARFFASAGPDAFFSVFGWNFCLTHGDAMGVGGGQGYIGPIAPITKGHRLLRDNASKTGREIHVVLSAHYHTTARTPFGYANGSVIGFNEYARDLRCDPEPAKQNMLVVHEARGVIAHHEIYLGSPEEGRLYREGRK